MDEHKSESYVMWSVINGNMKIGLCYWVPSSSLILNLKLISYENLNLTACYWRSQVSFWLKLSFWPKFLTPTNSNIYMFLSKQQQNHSKLSTKFSMEAFKHLIIRLNKFESATKLCFNSPANNKILKQKKKQQKHNSWL